MKPTSLIFLCAVLSGWLLGRPWSHGEAPVPAPSVEQPVAPPSRPAKKVTRKRPLTQDEFLSALKQHAADSKKPGFNPMADMLAGWTDEQVIGALRESVSDPAAHGLPGDEGNVTFFLLTEWMRRDLDAAAQWLTGLDSTLLKGQLTPCMSANWPPERAAEGLAFLVANEGIFGYDHGARLLTNAVNAAVMDGAPAVNGLMKTAREHGLEYFNVLPDFPPGFDFHALAEGGELKAAVQKDFKNPVILAWAKQDRDAAYQWTLENAGAGHVYEQLLGRKDGKLTADIHWAAERYGEMDAEQRQEFYGSMLGRWVQMPSDMRQLKEGMRDPALRSEMDQLSVQMLYAGNGLGAFLFLDAIED
ncbi:MAG: hypothetical protein EOP86_27320, partial [Verrucomicrobiaceae bacterium]